MHQQQIELQLNNFTGDKIQKKPTIHMDQYDTLPNNRDDELMNNSLKRLPRFKKIEIIFEVLALIILILCWAYFSKIFGELPEQVPTEFNYDGQVNRYMDKNILLALPGVDTAVYIVFTVLQFVPHRLNYDCIGITIFNAQQVYRLTRMALLYNKIVTELMFAYITFTLLEVVQYAYRTSVMYFAFLFIIPYIIGGVVYYKQLKKSTYQQQPNL